MLPPCPAPLCAAPMSATPEMQSKKSNGKSSSSAAVTALSIAARLHLRRKSKHTAGPGMCRPGLIQLQTCKHMLGKQGETSAAVPRGQGGCNIETERRARLTQKSRFAISRATGAHFVCYDARHAARQQGSSPTPWQRKQNLPYRVWLNSADQHGGAQLSLRARERAHVLNPESYAELWTSRRLVARRACSSEMARRPCMGLT